MMNGSVPGVLVAERVRNQDQNMEWSSGEANCTQHSVTDGREEKGKTRLWIRRDRARADTHR